MKAAAPVLVTFLLSVFIAVMSAPCLFWMQRRGVPSAIAVTGLLAGVVVVGGGLVAVVAGNLTVFYKKLPFYQQRIQDEASGIIDLLEKYGIDPPGLDQVKDQIDPSGIMDLVAQVLTGLGGVFTNAFLILLTVIFILFEASSLPKKIHFALENAHTTLDGFDRFTTGVNRYLAIKGIVSLMTGVFITGWLMFIGVDHAILWGLLAALLNFVPNIGSIIAAVPAVLLAFIQLGGSEALFAAFGYVLVNLVMGNVVEPRWMGRGLGLSTLIVFLSLVFWGWVLGPVGMLLSVPLTMIVKIALESNPQTLWMAIMLGGDPDEELQVEGKELSMVLAQHNGSTNEDASFEDKPLSNQSPDENNPSD
ncbi:hypothetical protein DC094_09875 [Pelagibaculum spongiae]|uniref:AI-2E family transporter n=2 Tax=Pelagibaculum spongiae TaxID=2080658 RepID=A0A2V1H296_9GAMM|nr:hypothetical protein DC094_09875 [Pelagibaculum spongiae]